MKRFLLLILVATMFSCSDDENNLTVDNEAIVGYWKGVSFTREDNGITYDISNCDNYPSLAFHLSIYIKSNSELNWNDYCSGGIGSDLQYSYHDGALYMPDIVCPLTKVSDTEITLQVPLLGLFTLEKHQ